MTINTHLMHISMYQSFMLGGGEIEINQNSFFHIIRLSFIYVCVYTYICIHEHGGSEVKEQVLNKAILYKI